MLFFSRPRFSLSPRLAIALIFLIRGFILGSWFPRIPGIADRLAIPSSHLGIIWFCTALGSVISFAIAARLMRRFGSARTLLIYAIPYPLIFTITSLAPSPLTFGIGMTLFGLLNGGFDVSSSVQGGIVERSTRRPLISALYGYFSIGALIGSFASGLLAQATLPIAVQFGVLSAVAIPLVSWFSTRLLADDAREVAQAPKRRGIRLTLPPRALWPLGIMIICVALGEETINNWVALYMRQDLGSSPAIAGFAYTVFCISTSAGRILGDRMIRLFGVDRILMGGSLLAASGIGFGMLINQPWALLVGYAAVGAGLSVVVPVTYRRAGEIPGMSPAVAVSSVATIGYLGFLLGPVLIGFVADLTSLRFALTIIAASLLGIFMIVRLTPAQPASARRGSTAPVAPLAEAGQTAA